MKCPNCSHEWTPDSSELAAEAGRKGGQATSRAKARAARRNAKLGGWPKGKKRVLQSRPGHASMNQLHQIAAAHFHPFKFSAHANSLPVILLISLRAPASTRFIKLSVRIMRSPLITTPVSFSSCHSPGVRSLALVTFTFGFFISFNLPRPTFDGR